jgi:hypothetical protein
LTTGEYSTIELGPKSAGVSTATRFTWVEHPGAVLLAHWIVDDVVQHRVFVGEIEATRKIQNGQIVGEFT